LREADHGWKYDAKFVFTCDGSKRSITGAGDGGNFSIVCRFATLPQKIVTGVLGAGRLGRGARGFPILRFALSLDTFQSHDF
jgi:hypothetical protein